MKIARFAFTLVALASTSCAWFQHNFNKPAATFNHVEVVRVGFDGVDANFFFDVTNPNPIDVDLQKLGYQITVDGHPFLAGSAVQAVHVPANGTGGVTVPVSVRFIEFINTIEALAQRPQVAYDLKVTLGVNTPIGPVDLPLETTGTFPTPRLPKFAFARANVSGLGMTGCNLNLVVNVSNDSAYDIPLGGFDYRVRINNAQLLTKRMAPVTIPKNAMVPVQLGGHVDFLQAGMAIFSAISSRSATVAFDADVALGPYVWPVHAERLLQ